MTQKRKEKDNKNIFYLVGEFVGISVVDVDDFVDSGADGAQAGSHQQNQGEGLHFWLEKGVDRFVSRGGWSLTAIDGGKKATFYTLFVGH